MVTLNLASTAAILTVISLSNASCGRRNASLAPKPSGSIIAHVGNSDLSPEDVGVLKFELTCGDTTVSGTPTATTGDDKAIKFSNASAIKIGATCRLSGTGKTSGKYTYMDPASSDGSENYYTSTESELSATRNLKLTIVKRFSTTGTALFDLTLNMTIPDITLSQDSKAMLSCGAQSNIPADITDGNNFIFKFNTSHFEDSEPVTCDSVTVISGTGDSRKAYKNKEALNLILEETADSQTQNVVLEINEAPVDSDDIMVSNQNMLSGTFSSPCFAASRNGFNFYSIASFAFSIEDGAAAGTMINVGTDYQDDKCTKPINGKSRMSTYQIDILNPHMTSLTNTLPVRISRADTTGTVQIVTNTIINVTGDILKFGIKTSNTLNAFFTGSINLDELPTKIQNDGYEKQAVQ